MPTVTTTETRLRNVPIATFSRHKVYNEHVAYFGQDNCIKFASVGGASEISKGSFEEMRLTGDDLRDFEEITPHQFVCALCECIQRCIQDIPAETNHIEIIIDGMEAVKCELAT